MHTIEKTAIAGILNCGKTTLFNSLTGARQRVGDWPGVTVENLYAAIGPQGGVLHWMVTEKMNTENMSIFLMLQKHMLIDMYLWLLMVPAFIAQKILKFPRICL